MKCKQVDNLLFSYCDRREIPPLQLKKLEAHLRECPECRRKADFTAREREALVYDGDIPEMSANFTPRVLASISQGFNPPTLSWGMRIRSQIGSRGWWAMGMAATVVLAWLMLPGILKELGQPTNMVKTTDSGERNLKSPVITGSTTNQEEGLNPQAKLKMSDTLGYKTIDPQRIATGRGQNEASLTPPNGSHNAADLVAVFRPSYLPPNYHLTRIESDLNDNLSLYYENDQGGFICLKTLPDLETDVEVMEDRGGGASPLMDSQNKMAESPASPTVIRWTSQHENTLFRLELTGSLPPEELARVAASVK